MKINNGNANVGRKYTIGVNFRIESTKLSGNSSLAIKAYKFSRNIDSNCSNLSSG